MWLTQFIEQNGVPLIAISVTLAALGFSIFSSIYSNLVHSAQMADGNAIQGDATARRNWLKLSIHLRELARSRAYSANLCYLGLLFTIFTLIIYFTPLTEYVCFATLVISLVLLITALVFASFLVGSKRSGKRKVKKRGNFCDRLMKLLFRVLWPVDSNVKRLPLDCSEE
jgi:dolichol kinase